MGRAEWERGRLNNLSHKIVCTWLCFVDCGICESCSNELVEFSESLSVSSHISKLGCYLFGLRSKDWGTDEIEQGEDARYCARCFTISCLILWGVFLEVGLLWYMKAEDGIAIVNHRRLTSTLGCQYVRIANFVDHGDRGWVLCLVRISASGD